MLKFSKPKQNLLTYIKHTRSICHNRILYDESSIDQPDTPAEPPKKTSSWDQAARNMGPQRRSPAALENAMRQLDEMRKKKLEIEENRLDVDAMFAPRFQFGTTYNPFDFSLTKQRISARQRKNYASKDPFEKSGIDPLSLWTRPVVLSNFISLSGRILPGYTLKTKGKNQKKLAKAIRRARATGLLSYVHKDVDFIPKENF